jgi:hypothetical protein
MVLKIQKKTLFFLIVLELALLVILFSFFPKGVFAGVGSPNVTVITNLTVGNVFPELSNVTIENNASNLALTPNTTRRIYCSGLATDYNGWNDITFASGVFFDNTFSTYGAANDNNLHYTNTSCTITQDGTYTDWINCSIDVWYYANPGIWNCTLLVNDTKNKKGYGDDTINISSLLALGLPDYIYYGEVNATEVSLENLTNVTNYGNVKINLSLSGYGFRLSDGNAMNCTMGAIRNISIMHEKYNLTNSNPGVLDLPQTIANYTNLTSAPVVKRFGLDFRQNDTFNEAINASYWRIYVPLGVAGTCQGNIVFGATVAPGT